ncbi:hypothetical protein B0H10DRAFT_1267336 [Mycena sp. CBHHK59/15]|nr:hypothetical protein B0H10DRAFT_1267336 [Mycena sp. CBHHK59/15]
MLSLGPGSACDVCLEPFGVELKAPCSIPCGHVFCVNCLQHIARPTCPLCRTPFEARNTIRLHIDLDNVRVPSSSTDKKPTSAGTDDGARQLQKRITGVATEGATEIQTTQLTAECRAFLETVPRNTYPELRTSFKMLSYMCHVKHLYINQGRTVDQLTRNTAALSQEVDLLNAALEALKIEKRRLEQSWQTLSTERDTLNSVCHSLREQLNDAETKLQLVTE